MIKNYLKIQIVFLAFLMFPTGKTFCQINPSVHIQKLLKEYQKTNNDSVKIERLSDLAFFYFDYLDDACKADSLSDLAIQIAEATRKNELMILAYDKYIQSNDLGKYNQKALEYALKIEQISDIIRSPELSYLTSKNLARVYREGYQYDKALEHCFKSLSIASMLKNRVHEAESYLEIGENLEWKNQKIEAFRYYINAMSIAEKEKDDYLLIECYNKLSRYYKFIYLFDKAIKYKLMQCVLVNKKKPVDSVALIWIEYDLQAIDNSERKGHISETNVQKVIDFAIRNKYQRLLNAEFSLYRSQMIDAGRIDLLKNFYIKKFPGELEKIAVWNLGLYYRIKAFLYEEDRQPDSALYFFNKAEKIVVSDQNMIFQSKFYYRFGQFLLRNGNTKNALNKFIKSYEMADKVAFFDYMLVASTQIQSLYAASNDFKNAYKYSVLNKVLGDSIANLAKKDQILVMEIDHESQQRAWLIEQEKQENLRRHNLQYMAMTICILLVFVILILLGSFSVPEWLIRVIGFFYFIFLFEFIILLADHKIYEITADEPWKIILVKIFLIAILFPLHHATEKKVITYLLNHKLLNLSQFSLGSMLKENARKLTRK